ncbi:DUF262 domain-containing protein [Embleya sp. NPDC055664]
MEAHPKTLRQLFGPDVRLVVPVFQRPYVWAADRNWRPLWEDVEALLHRKLGGVDVHPHFLGAVVLDQVSTSTSSVPARLVIDGQQRLTTLQILLAAVRDVAGELGVDGKFSRALTKLTVNEDELSDDPYAVYKVWPTNTDRDAFQAVMNGRARGKVDATLATVASGPVIGQAYRFFHDRTTEWAASLGENRLEAGFAALVHVLRESFEVVVIDLTPEDNAQVIFEALNDRGTPLQASDLVKNLIFQRAEEQCLPVEKLHEETWARLETPDWRREVRQGRLMRPRLDAFLNQYLTCELADEVPGPELFLTFRTYVEESGIPLDSLMRHVVSRAGVYDRLTADTHPASAEGRFLTNIGSLDVNTVIPLLLWLVTRFDEGQRAGAVAALDSFLVRRTVCRQTTKNYNRLFLDLLKELKAKDDPTVVEDFLLRQDSDSGFWPRDEDVVHVFRTQPLYKQVTRARLRLILAGLEDALYGGKTERTVFNGKLTIEHLLPQAWKDSWPLVVNDEESREYRESLLHTVGNLTLLTDKLNLSVSNGPWVHKRHEILKHSALCLNRTLPEQWDEAAIVVRAEYLAEVFCGHWPRAAGGVAPTFAMTPAPARPSQTTGSALSTAGQGGSRRDVGLHIQEAFDALPVGATLTVAEIAAFRSSQYDGGEISKGAVTNRLRGQDLPGIRTLRDNNPLSARKVR